jgi:drug/metabolite transporter (DMT)-like permease
VSGFLPKARCFCDFSTLQVSKNNKVLMKFLSNEQRGILYVVVSGLFYGLIGYFGVAIMHAGFSVYSMLFWRFSLAAIFMFFIILPKIKTFKYNTKELLKIFSFGGIFYGLSAVFYFISAVYIGTGIAMVLFFLYPVFVIFLNRLMYQEKISKTYHYSIITILFGLVMIADLSDLKMDVFGIVIGILGALLYAFYMIFSKKCKVSSDLSSLAMLLGCAFISLVLAMINDGLQIPHSYNLWREAVLMAAICTALPVLFVLKGLEHIDSAKASIFGVFEPLAVMFFGYILLSEKLTNSQLCGAALILFGAVLVLNPAKILQKSRLKRG